MNSDQIQNAFLNVSHYFSHGNGPVLIKKMGVVMEHMGKLYQNDKAADYLSLVIGEGIGHLGNFVSNVFAVAEMEMKDAKNNHVLKDSFQDLSDLLDGDEEFGDRIAEFESHVNDMISTLSTNQSEND